ncbi:MAG: hypothetical protein IJD89_00805, partial [Clostridia bacterium]|nr:hypothetical protein [Clostridia bacterium]
MCGEYIKVHILDVPYHADCEYTYYVPFDFRHSIDRGTMVVVPFGRANRHKGAIVNDINVAHIDENSSLIKPIASVLSSYLKLSSEMLELCIFLKSRTLCTVGEAVKSIIPSAIMTKTRERYFANQVEKSLNPQEKEIYEYVLSNEGATDKKIYDKFQNAELYLSRLIRLGAIKKETYIKEEDKSKYETRATLAVSKDEALLIATGQGAIKLRSPKQCEILKLLCEYDELTDKQIYEEAGAQKSHLDAL